MLAFAGTFLFLALAAGAGCKRSEPQDQPKAASPEAPACVPAYDGVATPDLAFKAYAQATQSAQWCRVINLFDKAARNAVALGAWKTLVVLASAESPQRAAYLQEFHRLAEAHGLDYRDQAKFLELATDLMNRRAASPALAPASAVIDKQPERFYVDTMAAIYRANPTLRATFGGDLADVAIEGDAATGKAVQSGRPVTFHFVKTPSGWLFKFQ